MKKVLFTLFFVCCFAGAMSAQEKRIIYTTDENEELEMPKGNLEEVVVTATKTQRKAIDVPTRIQSMPVFRLKANNVFMIDDILSQISGVSVSRTDGVYAKKSTVSVRGMGSDQGRTLVLLDGIPLNKLSTGSVNWNMIDPNDVARMEVVKGPGSSLYGGNAMGGTINIITRKATEGLNGYASLDWGSFNTLSANAGLSYSVNSNVYASLNGFYRSGDGFNAYPDTMQTEETIAMPLDETRLGGKIGWQINDNNNLLLSLGYYDGVRGTGDRIFTDKEDDTKFIDATNAYTNKEGRLQYNGHNDHADWNASAFFIGELMSETKYKSKQLYYVKANRQDWGVWGHYNYHLNESSNILAGLEYKGGVVDGRDQYVVGDTVINQGFGANLAVFAQGEFKFMEDRLGVVVDLRYDMNRFYKGAFVIVNPSDATSAIQQFDNRNLADEAELQGAFSPKLSLQYKFNPASRLYASVASGWRPGTLENKCWYGVKKTGFTVANPNLKPERILSYELGGDVVLADVVTASASGFYSQGTDYIYSVSTGRKFMDGNKEKDELKLSNIGSVSIYGGEADVNCRNLGIEGLDLFANVSLSKTKITKYELLNAEGKDDDLTGKALSYVPELLAGAGVTYRNPFANINVNYQYTGAQFMDDLNEDTIEAHGTLNAKLWYSYQNMLTLSLGGNNLLDKRFLTESDQLSMGRYLFVKLEYRLF